MKQFSIIKKYTGYIPNSLKPNQIFVFGANPEGKHGGGTALLALKYHGAIYGVARGLMGNSYGIVTTDLRINHRPNVQPDNIISEIKTLYNFAKQNPNKEFFIAYTGSNDRLLSGFTPKEIATMFFDAAEDSAIPENIIFEELFYDLVYSL